MFKFRNLLVVLLLAAAGFGVAACGSDSGPEDGTGSSSPAPGIEGITWELMNIGSDQGWATSLPAGVKPPTLRIENGQAEIFYGCNSGGGPVEVGPKTLSFGPLRITEMSCERVRNQIEFLVTKVLKGEVQYSLNSDGNLVLERAGDSLVYTRG